MSQAIWYIVSTLLSSVTRHYFDDFPTLERAKGCEVLSLAFSAVLDMLGWQHAKEGDKALNFAEAFDLLGVNFNLALTPKGILHVSNKASRIEKLCGLMDQISKEEHISPSRASELQGLLSFAVGFFSGKSLKHLVASFCLMRMAAVRTQQVNFKNFVPMPRPCSLHKAPEPTRRAAISSL